MGRASAPFFLTDLRHFSWNGEDNGHDWPQDEIVIPPVEPKARSDYAAMKPVVDAVAEGLSGTASEKVLQIHDFLTEKNT